MTNNTDAIVCRSLADLNMLIAEHITKPFPVDVLRRNPGIVEDYTTWAGVEAVIRWCIAQEYTYTLERQQANSCWLGGSCRVTINTGPGKYVAGHGEAESVAFCLAALASAGVRVRLELGGAA